MGDVFIVDMGASDIVEYAHGGSSPIAVLSDPGVPQPAPLIQLQELSPSLTSRNRAAGKVT